jgi:molybdopterin molybdotransferase
MSAESGFQKITSISSALSQFLDIIDPLSRFETISLKDADGRVLSEDVTAPINVPHYDRSAMDGYAVVASDTFGSGKDAGMMLKLIYGSHISSGECKQVHTGSALPKGADSVVMVENTERVGEYIEVLGQVSPGQNIGVSGEDVKKGSTVFHKYQQLKPSAIGLLLSLGLLEVSVFDKPKAMIIPTGDEIVPQNTLPEAGKMYESNGIMNLLYVQRFGGSGHIHEIVPDDRQKLSDAIKEGINYDLIITIGGSSVGKRDLTVDIVNSIGHVIVHGVSIKPGKPIAMGYIEEKGRRTPIICLPGYPAACAIDSMVFVDQAIKKLGNISLAKYRVQQAVLTRKIFSEIGFRTYTRVSIEDGTATPLRTRGAGVLSSISKADGYVIIPEDVEGYEAGSTVEVVFLEPERV